MYPPLTSSRSTKPRHALQNVPPGTSSRTIGAGCDFPVCTSVSSSYVSSIVPKPPGSMAKPCASLMNSSLRVKKYRKLTSLGSPSAMNWLVAASNGRRMLTPNALSGPAPSRPASMIPGPAPVMIIQSWAVIAVARRRAWS